MSLDIDRFNSMDLFWVYFLIHGFNTWLAIVYLTVNGRFAGRPLLGGRPSILTLDNFDVSRVFRAFLMTMLR